MFFFLILLFLCQSMYGSWAEETLRSLSLKEKIGQLFIVATNSSDETFQTTPLYFEKYRIDAEYITYLINQYSIGGIIYLGNNTIKEQVAATNYYQSKTKVPLLIAQDCEWGLNMRIKEVPPFPRQMTLGAIENPDLIREIGYEIGKQCSTMGIHLNLAPVADLNNNPLNPVINDRSFGQNKEKVMEYCKRLDKGMRECGILTCAKHFPGHGDTSIDSHKDLPIIEHAIEHLNDYELCTFKELIKDNIPCIMIAHLKVPALEPHPMPATFSKKVITFLKDELKFKGLIITDGLGMGALTNYYQPGEIELRAFLAGNDILLCPLDVPKAVGLIENAVAQNLITEKEIDEHVLKILKAKELACLKKEHMPLNYQEIAAALHAPQSDMTRKNAYEQAITLIGDLPSISSADRIGYVQINGKINSPFLEKLNSEYTIDSFYFFDNKTVPDELLSHITNDTVIIGIFDMNKFASKQFGISDTALSFLKKLNDQKKCLIITLFGNPYSLSLFTDHSSIIVAYEQEHLAQTAAANILLKKVQPKGSLPVDFAA